MTRPTKAGRAEAYRQANAKSALKIIAGNPAKYPPGSLPAVWAVMVINGYEATRAAWGLTA